MECLLPRRLVFPPNGEGKALMQRVVEKQHERFALQWGGENLGTFVPFPMRLGEDRRMTWASATLMTPRHSRPQSVQARWPLDGDYDGFFPGTVLRYSPCERVLEWFIHGTETDEPMDGGAYTILFDGEDTACSVDASDVISHTAATAATALAETTALATSIALEKQGGLDLTAEIQRLRGNIGKGMSHVAVRMCNIASLLAFGAPLMIDGKRLVEIDDTETTMWLDDAEELGKRFSFIEGKSTVELLGGGKRRLASLATYLELDTIQALLVDSDEIALLPLDLSRLPFNARDADTESLCERMDAEVSGLQESIERLGVNLEALLRGKPLTVEAGRDIAGILALLVRVACRADRFLHACTYGTTGETTRFGDSGARAFEVSLLPKVEEFDKMCREKGIPAVPTTLKVATAPPQTAATMPWAPPTGALSNLMNGNKGAARRFKTTIKSLLQHLGVSHQLWCGEYALALVKAWTTLICRRQSEQQRRKGKK